MKSRNLHCALTATACIGIVLCAALLSNAAEFKMQEFKMTDFKMSASSGEGTKQQASPQGKTQSVHFVFVVPKQQEDQKKKDSQESQKKPQSPVPSMANFALPVLPLPGMKK